MTWPPAIHGDIRVLVETIRSLLFDSPGPLLVGVGAPPSGSGLDPLNGVNDPWRWWPPQRGAPNGFWASDPVSVSWSAGATIPSFAAPAGGELGLILGSGTTPYDVNNYPSGVAAFTGFAGDPYAGGSRNPSSPFTLPASGSGAAYLLWSFSSEETFALTPYTNTSANVLPAETRTVADVLGSDFTVTGTTWSEASVGVPGQFYYDSDAGDLYGPRQADGTWPFLATLGMSPVYNQFITAGSWVFANGTLRSQSPDLTTWKILVANDGTLSTEVV